MTKIWFIDWLIVVDGDSLIDWCCQERVKWYTMMVYEDADATLLRLYESFMESAPQLGKWSPPIAYL
jgi:hypothetical protein